MSIYKSVQTVKIMGEISVLIILSSCRAPVPSNFVTVTSPVVVAVRPLNIVFLALPRDKVQEHMAARKMNAKSENPGAILPRIL